MSQESSGDDSAYVDDDTESAAANSPLHEPSPSIEEISRLENGHNQQGTATDVLSIKKRVKDKRLSRKFKEAYRDLFNTTIYDATGQQSLHFDRTLEPPSQIGATTWTSNEKETFFRKLPILGRDNLKALSAAIETKSEIEVHQYIQLLSEGVVEATLTQNFVTLATNIPAACEVSGECVAVLEAAADVLADEQLGYERQRENRKFGDYWLLNQQVASEVETIIDASAESAPRNDKQTRGEEPQDEENEGDNAPLDLPVPAAELLHLPNWLELSKIFMWQAEDGSENWTDYITPDSETPSLYHTAFQDFHTLAVSLTRRLLQATIFQAESRLRARDRESPSRNVYVGDVHAAASILNLKTDRKQFWAGISRRHGLKVYLRHKKGKPQSTAASESEADNRSRGDRLRLSYDEVEEKLGMAGQVESQANEDALDTVEDVSELLDAHDDSDMWTEVSVTGDDRDDSASSEAEGDGRYHPDEDDDDDAESESRGAPASNKRARMLALMKQLDSRTEAFDRDASAVEEARLWTLLDLPAPVHIKEEIPVDTTAFHMKRKVKSEMRDWRHVTDYQAEWASHGGIVPPEQFSAMQSRGVAASKRRKLANHRLTHSNRRSSRQRTLAGSENVPHSSDDDSDPDDAQSPPQPQAEQPSGEMHPMQSVEINSTPTASAATPPINAATAPTSLPLLSETRRAATANAQDHHRPQPPTSTFPRASTATAATFLDRLTLEKSSSHAQPPPSHHRLSDATTNKASSPAKSDSDHSDDDSDSEDVGPTARPSTAPAPLDSDEEAPDGWVASLKRTREKSVSLGTPAVEEQQRSGKRVRRG